MAALSAPSLPSGFIACHVPASSVACGSLTNTLFWLKLVLQEATHQLPGGKWQRLKSWRCGPSCIPGISSSACPGYLDLSWKCVCCQVTFGGSLRCLEGVLGWPLAGISRPDSSLLCTHISPVCPSPGPSHHQCVHAWFSRGWQRVSLWRREREAGGPLFRDLHLPFCPSR